MRASMYQFRRLAITMQNRGFYNKRSPRFHRWYVIQEQSGAPQQTTGVYNNLIKILASSYMYPLHAKR